MALQENWDDLRLLLAVSRRGSFLQAGQLLGIAASTVARRLTQLEGALGEPLVERGVEGCRLTPRGQSLVDVALAAGEVAGHLHRVIIKGRNYLETRNIFVHILLLFFIELKFELNT